MTTVRLEKIVKQFDSTFALRGIDLQIEAGELFFLLGPSGCGKTTLLRLIAGLGEPTSGRIWLNDTNVTRFPTQKRNAVMCFQNYALWPHMTVMQNILFGLEVRNVVEDNRRRKAQTALDMVQMGALAERKPAELSGGQQQRVALARALAVNPACLLLDEPLSNLDAQLRLEMRGEIRRICKSSGFTTIYVTHDQKEALSVADRIAVLKDGELAQVGTPTELYYRPRSRFVAEFVGQTNIIKGEVIGQDGDYIRVQTEIGTLRVVGRPPQHTNVHVSIRPEHLRIGETQHNIFDAIVRESTFLGESSEHILESGGRRIKLVASPPLVNPPAKMTVGFLPEHGVLLES